MRIRKFKKKDARKVFYLIRKNIIEVNSKDYPKNIIKKIVANLKPSFLIEKMKTRHILVIEEKERIVGTVSVEDGVVYTLHVHPGFHGKGIGKKLMTHLEKLAKKTGHKYLKVPSSITAFAFYKKLGYKKIKEVHCEKSGKYIIMKKKL